MSDKTAAAQARKQRLAKALKANIARRKQAESASREAESPDRAAGDLDAAEQQD